MSKETFHSILGNKVVWSAADVEISGVKSMIDRIRRCFDHAGIAG